MPIKQHEQFTNFHEVLHPLIQHKLSMLRNVHTDTKEFKELVNEITLLLGYEVTKDLPMTLQVIKTPLEACEVPVLRGRKQVIMPILRAGIGMVEALLALMPSARVAHIGIYRDEKTLEPQFYFLKVPPKSADRQYYICDPMLATGGTAVAAITKLKELGVKKITFLCIIAAPQGVARVFNAHPDVPVFTAGLDRELNSKGYILPGLGDAGDRMFGTK